MKKLASLNLSARVRSVSLGFVLALGLAQTASANLVTNGDFETGDFTGWSQFDNTGFTGVTGNFGGVNPVSGSFQAFFGPVGSTGGILQNLTTVAGQAYTIDLWVHNFGGDGTHFGVTWEGNDLGTPTFPLINVGGFEYTHFSFTAVATDASSQLAIVTQQNPSYWLVDDVSVNAARTNNVPDSASTFGMIGLAMLGLVAVRRRLA
jgi:hypothetical protein